MGVRQSILHDFCCVTQTKNRTSDYQAVTNFNKNFPEVRTYTVDQHNDETIEITLLTIYDKGEMSAITDKYIKWLVSLING